jgi:hypothetical protein
MELEDIKNEMTQKDILYYTIQNMEFEFLEFLLEENKFDRKKLNN